MLVTHAHPRPSFIDIDSLFDGILLECAVQDEYARRFWTGAFGAPLQERVTWDEFVPRFFAFLQLPPPDLTRPRRRDMRSSPMPVDGSGAVPDLRGVPAAHLEDMALATPSLAPAVKTEMERREGMLWAAALKELLCPKYSPVALERDMVRAFLEELCAAGCSNLDEPSLLLLTAFSLALFKVTLERFGKITQQFGPVRHPSPPPLRGANLLS